MAKCGCSGDACSCTVIAGNGARVTGAGTTNNPYIIDAFPMSIAVADSSTVDLTMTGTGATGDPLTITATVGGSLFASKWTRWTGTQTAYNALGTYDAGTLYVITGP